ncbi:MAG: glycerate kinase [Deltaproteobacteria bacterium]|uniref:Glycerate kinase n=1 Tax=Candidatus Zymogenus saltonus TaxID=2844893 RepID=A0A9D8KDV0_9DELT|nr:glycerate kinase [Candidatus Zymogenus saltonus]
MHEEIKEKGIAIFRAATKSVDPYSVTTGELEGRREALRSFKNIYVIGIGKAAHPMTRAAEDFFGDRITGGVVVTKYGHGDSLKKIEVIQAGHPIPDERGVTGAGRIYEIALKAGAGDGKESIVIVLISGGGSALMTAPADGITLGDLKSVNEGLIASGADIHEINCVRKHLSKLKGGWLARIAHPAAVLSLIISDVVGDDISTIASGPTTFDPTTFEDAMAVIERYDLRGKIPRSVIEHLSAGARGDVEETPKGGDPIFADVENVIVGSAAAAMTGAEKKAKEEGFNAVVLSSAFAGDTEELALFHKGVAAEVAAQGRPVPPPACIISGGESTVRVTGPGKGGRNTHFALCFAALTEGAKGTYGLFLGSDGTDGPTNAAGAFSAPDTISRARSMDLDAERYLKECESYNFFELLGDLVITGPTKNNVMDIRLVFVIKEDER